MILCHFRWWNTLGGDASPSILLPLDCNFGMQVIWCGINNVCGSTSHVCGVKRCHPMNLTEMRISGIVPKEFNFHKSDKLYYYSSMNTMIWAHHPGGIQKSACSFLIRSHTWASLNSWTCSPSNGWGRIWARAWALLLSIIGLIRMKEVAWNGYTDFWSVTLSHVSIDWQMRRKSGMCLG